MRALLEADLIVAGPGSLYTSVLPNLLVPDVARAVEASRALKVYICNVATQRGETEGYSAGEHIAALEATWEPGSSRWCWSTATWTWTLTRLSASSWCRRTWRPTQDTGWSPPTWSIRPIPGGTIATSWHVRC